MEMDRQSIMRVLAVMTGLVLLGVIATLSITIALMNKCDKAAPRRLSSTPAANTPGYMIPIVMSRFNAAAENLPADMAVDFAKHYDMQVSAAEQMYLALLREVPMEATIAERDANNPKSRQLGTNALEKSQIRPVPDWLTLNKEQFKGTLTRIPTREELNPVANEQLVVELYSRS